MSDNESHYGKLRLIQSNEGESFLDLCKRLWISKGNSEEDFEISRGSNSLLQDYYDDYVQHGDKLFEIFDHVESDDEYFCKLVESDGIINFHCQFYNGGTCLSECLEDGLEELFKNKEQISTEKFITSTRTFKVKDLFDSDLVGGDYVEYQGIVYQFDGWEYGHDAILTNLETNKQIRVTC
jgi:hypothetical protein